MATRLFEPVPSRAAAGRQTRARARGPAAVAVVRKESFFSSTVALNGAVRATTWGQPTKGSGVPLPGDSLASTAAGRITHSADRPAPCATKASVGTIRRVAARPALLRQRGRFGGNRHCRPAQRLRVGGWAQSAIGAARTFRSQGNRPDAKAVEY